MNRFNSFLLVFLSLFASFLAVFLYFRERERKEPRLVSFPLTVEVYRIDRYPLPEADVYLNGEFIGRTDEKGFFRKGLSLLSGESCILRVEREREGFAYGPWETRFTVREEGESPGKIPSVSAPVHSLQGESDLALEIERAYSGKASVQDQYHFLALVDGYMFYTIRVSGSREKPVEGATVVVDGRVEGTTDERGTLVVRYSGEEERRAGIRVVKSGTHMWMSEETVKPASVVDIALNKMLLIDVFALTESYGLVSGIPGVHVFVNGRYSGKTDSEGFFTFAYRNDLGVDGDLQLTMRYPGAFIPEVLTRTFFVEESLPKLAVTDFAYPKKAAQPKLAVVPFTVKGKADPFLERSANTLRTRVEDFVENEGVFLVVPSDGVRNLFRRFKLDYTREGVGWKEIPPIKKEIDALVYGEIWGSGGDLSVRVYGVDYTGERFYEVEGQVSIRELLSLSEDIAAGIRASFPMEGNIVGVDKRLTVNLGKSNGVRENNRFNGFTDYFDEVKKGFAKKRVVRFRVVETGETESLGELESVSGGYFLEAGLKIKRVRETGAGGKEVQVAVGVYCAGSPVPDANVYADDDWVGQTAADGSLRFSAPAGGTVDLLVYKDGYLPGSRSVKVGEGMGVLAVDLKRGESLFTVDSEPRGALVFIDGVLIGATPLTQSPIPVPLGFHLLEAELKGYKKIRRYVNFKDPETSFTGTNRLVMHWDYYKIAEQRYANNNVYGAMAALQEIPRDHPDYVRGRELLGYISLKDLRNYSKAVDYYTSVIEIENAGQMTTENLLNRYNAAQAHLGEAERILYSDTPSAKTHLYRAIHYLTRVREGKNRLPAQDRSALFQDTLFGLAVAYQKLFYVSANEDLLERVSLAWSDYFDFFDDRLLREDHFAKQYSVAQTLRKEVERLKGER